MRAKRIVAAAALVALVSGGAALAADDRTTGDAGATAKSGDVDIYQSEGEARRVARYRANWNQVRYVPPNHGDRRIDTCTNDPFAQLLAGLFGFEEIARRCEAGD